MIIIPGRQIFKRMLCLCIVILSFDLVYSGQTYYVSPQGSDSNNGTINAPWQNLLFAVRNVSPGDTIIMRGGTYIMGEVWIDRNKGMGGKPGKYLTIKAYPGEEPILKPGRRRLILWADYVRIEGLHFIMPWRCDAFGDGLQIINNKFTGPQPKFGAIETGGNDILVEGNFIQIDDAGGNTQDHGIYVHKGERITVRNNTIIGSKGYGIHVFDEHKSADPADWAANPFVMKDYILEGNFIMGSQERSGIIIAKGRGSQYITLENIIVRKNVLVGNAVFGLFIREGNNIQVLNNTFYQNGVAYGNTSLFIDNDTENITIKNNIFQSTFGHVVNSSSGTNIILENNLYFPNILLEGISDPSAIQADPLFVDAQTNNFHLQPSSPAIDAGVDVGLPFSGAAPDLGAFEFENFPTNVKEAPGTPKGFLLHQNYPNPFNPETKIKYEIPFVAHVKLSIYNLIGQQIKVLVDQIQETGAHSISWNGKNQKGEIVPSGVYFYRLEILQSNKPVIRKTKRMIFLR
ncbi:MAG: DUF5123 domain-containing protein [Calditrichaeota bacterium]|nr:MAG: DUF5123 domain-containing protein [Calditrichota bacterium]